MRCPRESHRTLRHGSLEVALAQALRARLRSTVPPGQKAALTEARGGILPRYGDVGLWRSLEAL